MCSIFNLQEDIKPINDLIEKFYPADEWYDVSEIKKFKLNFYSDVLLKIDLIFSFDKVEKCAIISFRSTSIWRNEIVNVPLPYMKIRIENERAYNQANHDLRIIPFIPGMKGKIKEETHRIIQSPEMKQKIQEHAQEISRELNLPKPLIETVEIVKKHEEEIKPILKPVKNIIEDTIKAEIEEHKKETTPQLSEDALKKEEERLKKNLSQSPKSPGSFLSRFMKHKEKHGQNQRKILESAQDSRINNHLFKGQLLYTDSHGKISSLPKGIPGQFLSQTPDGLEWNFLPVERLSDFKKNSRYSVSFPYEESEDLDKIEGKDERSGPAEWF